ncbi:MAG: transketolase C-terminal domain-containing protein [Desulfuromonadaceae bacterium]|nr:transketolase C-terminal domain-containing protein [Desulfuromonadaceae bacterium]MDD5104197.1 transketolase C-terminal domain-containing protein [Desulfuromonadaceae bacterium]
MTKSIDIRDAFFDELYEIAAKDHSVIFMAADMGAFSLERFRRDFPDRFINVGIAEQNLISVAAGLALSGKKVFVYAIIPFITLRCLEQIKVDLCIMNLPVTIIGAGSGFTYSSDGPTHHAIEDVSIMRALPGMTIFNPSDQITAQHAAKSASDAAGPVYVRLDKGAWPVLHEAGEDLSKGLTHLRNGSELLIIATGNMTHSALQIADELHHSGIKAGVVDLFCLKPVSGELVGIAKGYDRIVTLEEHTLAGGMGSAVLELFAGFEVMIPVKRFGIQDVYPAGYGDREWMKKEQGIDAGLLINKLSAIYGTICERIT